MIRHPSEYGTSEASEVRSCPYCKGTNLVKHGKTSNGKRRYRCVICRRTFSTDKIETIRPDVADIVEAYLNGRTYRDLVPLFKSSPQRINIRIREFLEGVPNWEDFVDTIKSDTQPSVVYLTGIKFWCVNNKSSSNEMFLAAAVDGLSTVIIGYEISLKESTQSWVNLLSRLKLRGFLCSAFVFTGQDQVNDAISEVFPHSIAKLYYHKIYKDKELDCCLRRLPINGKLINEAINSFTGLQNNNLKKYLADIGLRDTRSVFIKNSSLYTKRLRDRLDNWNKVRLEGLMNSFNARYEKFHMLKDNPEPVINGWIAKFMLSRLDHGFNRVSLFTQIPSLISFKDYSCGNLPKLQNLQSSSPVLEKFLVELATRGVQLPMQNFRCEMKMDNCSLTG